MSTLYPIPRRRFPIRASETRTMRREELAWLRYIHRCGGLIVTRFGREIEYRLVAWHPEIEGDGG